MCDNLLLTHPMEDPVRQRAVAMLATALVPVPAARSPFEVAHELEQLLHDRHGGAHERNYTRHALMLWHVLGGPLLCAFSDAAEAERDAREAAAAAAAAAAAVVKEAVAAGLDPQQTPEAVAAAAAAAAADAAEQAATEARKVWQGVPGAVDSGSIRAMMLDGEASAEDLFTSTHEGLFGDDK
jgi:hypothetical protein